MRVLAGDIGGTHARLAIVELGPPPRILADNSLPTQKVKAFLPMVESFLTEQPARPDRACLGIAGPVVHGTVSGTNLPWQLNARELGEALGIPRLAVINDFAAAAYGLALLAERDFLTLQPGAAEPGGVIALIGAGTGLGQAFVVRNGTAVGVHSSEGGHSTFAPDTPAMWELFTHLRAQHGHVSWERVVSGPGLIGIFEFLAGAPSAAADDGARLRREMTREDAGRVITRHALAHTSPLAERALELFIQAYGAQAGNLALTVLATGGVYLAGGIARNIASTLAEGPFMTAFREKGRMRAVLERVPVRVILNKDVGLLGAASVAERS